MLSSSSTTSTLASDTSLILSSSAGPPGNLLGSSWGRAEGRSLSVAGRLLPCSPSVKSPRVLLVGVVALVALFAVAYFTLFNPDSPKEFSLENQQGATNAAAPPAGDLAGTWSVSEGTAGYRVREKLAALPAPSDAVGRTNAITGQVTISESTAPTRPPRRTSPSTCRN